MLLRMDLANILLGDGDGLRLGAGAHDLVVLLVVLLLVRVKIRLNPADESVGVLPGIIHVRINLGCVQPRDLHTHLVQAEDPAADQSDDQHQSGHRPAHSELDRIHCRAPEFLEQRDAVVAVGGDSSADGDPPRFDARGWERWRRRACGVISRSGSSSTHRSRTLTLRSRPNRRPWGTSCPGTWASVASAVWQSRRRRLHAIPQAVARTMRDGFRRHISLSSRGMINSGGGRGRGSSGGRSAGDRGCSGRNKGSAKETCGSSSRHRAPILFFIVGRRHSTGNAESVAVAAAEAGRRLARGQGAKLQRRQSTRDERVTKSSGRPDRRNQHLDARQHQRGYVSQNVETMFLRSVMATRFSNVVIRGSLADVRRDGFMSDRLANSAVGRVPLKRPRNIYYILIPRARGTRKSKQATHDI